MAKISDDTTITVAGDKPLLKIPDVTGIPFFTAIKDRIDFFYRQGQYEYFRSRVAAAGGATVLRLNMIPGPFCSNPRVIALCDSLSFASTLFDPSKVIKTNTLTGRYCPAAAFTGGHRVCCQLDVSNPTHAKMKQVFFDVQAARKTTFISTFISNFDLLFDAMEDEVMSTGSSLSFSKLSEAATFNFFCETLIGTTPSAAVLAAAEKYVFLQFHPIMTGFGYPMLVEEILIHSFPFPSLVARKTNRILYDYFSSAGSWILDQAVKAGINRDEACHHLIFSSIVNGFLGLRGFLLRLFKWVVSAGPKLHLRLAAEVRSVLGSSKNVTFVNLESMELVKSVVYEVLRIDPPVQVQYGRARRDMIVESHTARYEVKEGEMVCGFQPMATRDGVVFEKAEEFVAERFVGEEGRQLLKYVLWSNGPETGRSEVDNKVCAGKEMGVMVGRLMLVVMFRRYDEIVGEVGKTMEELGVTVTQFRKKNSFVASA